jgi:glutamate/tyrosine decarboxylase-like PLP-dependent enzyme
MMKDLLHEAASRAIAYLAAIRSRPVAPTAASIEHLRELDGSLPQGPIPPEKVLELLDRLGSPATVASAGGRYFGFVVGGSLPTALAANWLAGAWDQNAMCNTSSPVAGRLEEIVLGWLVELLGLPPGCGGAIVTGATMANFAALAAARHALLKRAGWDAEADGLFGAPRITIMASEDAHPTLLKAIGLLGLGHRQIVRVSADEQGRMRASALPKMKDPTIVCLQAGQVNTGAFDPVPEICAAAHAAGAWVHIDGAFGLWAAVAPARAHLVAGVADADSWATDAHKWLNVPYDSGLVFVRDGESLRAAMTPPVAYLPDAGVREPWQYTPEASRRARGVEIWAALMSLGRSGVADLVERTCRHASHFADRLREAGYEILNEVVLNQVLVSFGSDELTRQVVIGVQQDGTCWCGAATLRGKAAMRISVSSWATTEEDVDRSVTAILAVARRLCG